MGQGSSGKRGSGAKKSGGVIQAGDNSASAAGMERIQNMSDKEYRDYLSDLNDGKYDWRKEHYSLGDYYNLGDTQMFIADNGINSKPTVVAKGEVDKIAQQNRTPVIYRGLKNHTDMSATDIANQMMYDPLNKIGYGVYGDGFYFSDKKSTAATYGDTVVKATLSPNAKVIDYDTLIGHFNDRRFRRSALDEFGGSDHGESILALSLGYNIIRVSANRHGSTGEDYYVVVDRSAMIVEEV